MAEDPKDAETPSTDDVVEDTVDDAPEAAPEAADEDAPEAADDAAEPTSEAAEEEPDAAAKEDASEAAARKLEADARAERKAKADAVIAQRTVTRRTVTSRRVTPKAGAKPVENPEAPKVVSKARDARKTEEPEHRYEPPSTVVYDKGPSPWWVPALMFGLLIVGALIIMLNYMGAFGDADNIRLVVGLVFILGGIITATQYR